MPVYFFAGGLSGAASVLGAAAHLVGGPQLGRLARRCHWLATMSTGASALLRLADPSTAAPRNVRTPSLTATWVSATAALLAGRAGALGQLGDLAGLAAGAVGVPMAGYAAVLLADSAAPVWQDAKQALPALFLGSALASAASLLELLPMDRQERDLVRSFGVAGKATELAGLFAAERDLAQVPGALRRLSEGLPGRLWTAAKLLDAASLGLMMGPGESAAKRVLSAALGTAGAMAMRFAVVAVGRQPERGPLSTFVDQGTGQEGTARAEPPPAPAVGPPAAPAANDRLAAPQAAGARLT